MGLQQGFQDLVRLAFESSRLKIAKLADIPKVLFRKYRALNFPLGFTIFEYRYEDF